MVAIICVIAVVAVIVAAILIKCGSPGEIYCLKCGEVTEWHPRQGCAYCTWQSIQKQK